MSEPYDPKHVKPWKHPDNYFGEIWPDYYVFLTRTRDSDILTNSNFEKGLEYIGGERTEGVEDGEDLILVTVVRESHWACGWVEWIAIHSTEYEALRKADEVMAKLEDYPILNEDHYSEKENEETQRVWENCYDNQERIAYIRKRRGLFEFRDFADMLTQAKGKYFGGCSLDLLSP